MEAATLPRILVTGAEGMLGRDLVPVLSSRGWSVRSPFRSDLDIARPDDLTKLKRFEWGPLDWVVNCAAYTDVDRAETEFALASRVNGIGAGALAVIAAENGWRLLHLSTDYVFDGAYDGLYTEAMTPRPLNRYGMSKRFGEEQALAHAPDSIVLRTSWLFGAFGKCFPGTMIDAWRAGKPLRVVSDQRGTPTATVELARVIGDVIQAALPGGVYHAAGPDHVSWHDFAVRALEAQREAFGPPDAPITVEPCATADWPTAAKRPANSGLSSDRLTGLGVAPMRALSETLPDFVRAWAVRPV